MIPRNHTTSEPPKVRTGCIWPCRCNGCTPGVMNGYAAEMVELCGSCGVVVGGDDTLYAFVPDSSVIHGSDPKFDGNRLLTACSPEHLDDLVKQYADRPFVEAEQWSGKVERAIVNNPGRRIDDAALAELTGLTGQQIHQGITWHNKQAHKIGRRQRARR